MSIYVYTGVPGSGKSAHCAREIRENLNRSNPRPVIANFELGRRAPVKHREHFHYVTNAGLRVEDLEQFASDYWETQGNKFKEDAISIYLDEAQLLFNARLWNSKDRLRWLEFLSQSRKYGYRVVLIAQSAKMIDNQFRMLVETEVNHRRMSACGVAGWLMSLPFRGRLIMYVNFMFQLSERTGAGCFLLNRRDFMMYDSYKKFDPSGGDVDLRLLPETEVEENEKSA